MNTDETKATPERLNTLYNDFANGFYVNVHYSIYFRGKDYLVLERELQISICDDEDLVCITSSSPYWSRRIVKAAAAGASVSFRWSDVKKPINLASTNT